MEPNNKFDFPVGNENEHSVKLLFKFFCNNLYLGQWELAQSCVSRLAEDSKYLTVDIKNILKDVITYPFNRSLRYDDVGSSHHLSWLCLQEYKKLLEEEEKEDQETVLLEKTCEFHILLLEACTDTSENVIKDLYLYQRAVSQTFTGKEISSQPLSLSTDLLNFLHNKLLENPLLGHSVIQSIYACPKHSQYKKNNENLQGLYVTAINHLLDKISYTPSQHGEETNEKVEKVYKLLSLFNPEQYQNYLSIRELFARFYELSVFEEPVIDRNKVLSVIIGREDTYLVEEFCKVEFDLEMKCLLSVTSCHNDELSEEQKILLSLVKQKDKEHQMKVLFLMCIKKHQHFLKLVVETSIALIRMGQFDVLKMLLEPAEFQPLKPLLLLHGWSYCHSCQTAKKLLDALWSEESTCFHPALEMGCSKLAYQIDLIQWCLDKTKPLVSEVALTSQHQRAADMFTGLENHTVLYVLHQSTRIASLDQQEVLEILKKSPLQNDKGPTKLSHGKSVTFAEDNNETEETQSSQSSDIAIERWRDISIFSGYCAIRNVMDAIYFCVDYADSKLMNPIQRKDFHSSSLLHSSDGKNDSERFKTSGSKKKNFQEIYTKNVTDKLLSTREYLSKLQPLTFRVEILQDIFSLLFANHECIQESAFYEDTESDEEYGDDRSRHSTVENLHISLEGSLTSPELLSPLTNSQVPVFSLTPAENEQSMTGSYDEPFIDTKKVTKLIARQNSFKKNEMRNKEVNENHSSFDLDNLLTDLQADPVVSENGSTFSTESSIILGSVGFLNNEYLVRDILDMLKNALFDLESAQFKIRGTDSDKDQSKKKSSIKKSQSDSQIEVSLEEPLTNLISSSVTKESLNQAVSKLRIYINEANWRFQLVCHDKIPKTPGEVLLEPVIVPMELHEEEIYTDLMGVKEKKRQFSPRKRLSVDASTLIPKVESDSGTDNRKVKRSRSRSRNCSLTRAKFPAGIVSLMLSSSDTLLTMCLQKCNYNQASQVTKMLKLEDRPEFTEVNFSQSFSSAVKRLHSLNLGTQKPSAKISKPGQLSMKALGSVAAAGVATVSVSSVADELMSLPKLPKLPQPKCKIVHTSKLDKCFNQENCSAMILFDLLCTGCRSWETCNNMVDAIKSRKSVNGPEKSDSKRSGKVMSEKGDKTINRLRDIWDISNQFEEILQLGTDIDGNQNQGVKNVLITFYKHSIQALLKIATLPLYPEDCQLYAKLLSDLKIYVDKVEHAFQLYGKLSLDHKGLKSSPKNSPFASPSSKASYSPTDKPVIHNAMKHLISVLQNDIPQGGLITIFTRNSSKEKPINRDYLQNLYDHLKGLAMVVAESEATSKETMVIPSNYFKMLDEGPISTLGRLMFSKKIPPSKLERVAKKLSLNLNHIIVHSCCPRIPSKHLPDFESGFTMKKFTVSGAHMIMNQSSRTLSHSGKASTHPELLVRKIITKLTHLMKETAEQNNAKGIFEISSAQIMIKTPAFADIISSTQKLKTVDLNELKTNEEKLAFFGNLQNLMFLHMCMFLIEDSGASKEDDIQTGSIVTTFTEMKIMDQLLWLNMFSYDIGQMGIVSLFDLKYLVNRNGLFPPSEFDGLLENRITELDPEDPWNEYIPPPEPRLLFVTTNCTSSSPAIQVLVPELLKSQLQLAMKDYLENGVRVDKDNKVVTIPKLLMCYKADFDHQQENQTGAENEGIIHFFASLMTGQQHTSIQELLQLDRGHADSAENIDTAGRKELAFDVVSCPNKKEFLVAFNNAHLQHIEVKGHKRMTSLPKNLDLSVSKSVNSLSSSTTSFGKYASKYSLTPSTLEYVKSECPLVATLVSLVCDDDLDTFDDQFTEDHFAREERLRKRTSSEISLVDIRSYRYQKLTDTYPTLKQHFLNFIIPIAGSQDEEIIKSGDPVLKLITSAISDKLKACMLSLHTSLPFQDVLTAILDSLVVHSKWLEILNIIQSFPSIIQNEPKYRALSQLCLENKIFHILSHSLSPRKKEADEISWSLKRLCNPAKMCHILLSIYKKLPLEVAQDLFYSCFNDDLPSSLKESVTSKQKEMYLYSRITECAKTLQVRLSMRVDPLDTEDKGDYHSLLDKFSDWRNIMTVISPADVLSVLIKARDYETARQWCQLKDFPMEKYMDVIASQLMHLLNGKPAETTKAFLILEDLKTEDNSMCFDICYKLLNSLSHQREVLFVVSYMLKQLTIPDEKQEELKLIKIGSQAILCLPEPLHFEYSHLVTTPKLLLEQLLMNMKIDFAGKVYNTIKNELETFQTKPLNNDCFNSLVSTYAKKALDFTVVVVDPIIGPIKKDRSQSQISTASSERLAFTESSRHHSRNSASPRPSLSGSAGMTSGKSLLAKRGKFEAAKFVMPPEPPPVEKWQPDNSTDTCMVCKVEKFSMFNRRHHCRRCGRVVCGTCSTKKSTVNNLSVRTCDDCYKQIFGDSKQEEMEEEMYKNRGNPSDSSLSRVLSPGNALPIIDENLCMADAIHHTQILWKLEKNDDQANDFIREDFYYEQAPSTSLCLSILGLHEDPKMSGQLMLNMCDDLSKHLKPIAPGVPNPEVDYSLLLSMMKTLLFHAKMNFSRSKRGSDGIGQCDVYQSRIDLLSLLVSDNFSDLPSIQELSKPEIVMRLRDSLIKNERLNLAVEVSTKCGLDPAGVWAEWGMNCLNSGDFTAAREKFSRCLKRPVERNIIQTQPSKIIADIIDCLESMPSNGHGELQLLLASPGSMHNLLLSASLNLTEETATDSVPFQECLYYLKTYAPFNIIIDFYRKNGYWMKAVQYIIDHKCSSEVFIEALLAPSVHSGEWGKMVDQMVMIDPSFEKWNVYLKSTCKYLLKHKLHHILYEFQLVMKDFIRAAMTCITFFYQSGAQSYLDLFNRISFLYDAHKHLQSYMDPSQWGSVSRPLPSPAGSWSDKATPKQESVRLIQSEEEVGNHLKMLAIQIEVTKFLHLCLRNTESNAAAVATKYIANSTSSQLPTMFSSKKVRTDLVIMILMSGNDIPAAFDLALRIIKECKLGGQAIYTHAAREMARHQRYDQIKQLLDCICKAGLGEDDMMDEIIGACILIIADNPNEAKEAENLIKLLRKDSNKINAYILCGKLRSAYLMAVKAERVEDVQRIEGAAQRMGQTAVKNICNKWLEQKKKS